MIVNPMGGMGGQKYELRWNDFHASLISSFRHLRAEEDFIDVTIACEEAKFTAHKVVLSACSPYFRSLLKSNPCQHPIVILRDVREQDMDALLSFMYNGEVHISHDRLTDFLKTAQMLQVRGLADVISKEAATKLAAGTHTMMWPRVGDETSLTDIKQESMDQPPSKKFRGDGSSNGRYIGEPLLNGGANVGGADNGQVDSSQTEYGAQPEHTMSNTSSLQIRPLLDSSSGILHSFGDDRSNASYDDDEEASDAETDDQNGDLSIQPVRSGSGEPSDYSHGDRSRSNSLMSPMFDSQRHRPNSYPGGLFNLQGITAGLMPGPSSMHNNGQEYGKVRATDPRPCPKCGKIYRSAHTLRTHLEDKHTVCPGYRCVLCGTVAKSRNSLHSHMSRQHRGISTKDLPVLAMPAPFDPHLASKLFAKAGIKMSPSELKARASPTGSQMTPNRRLDRSEMPSTESQYSGDDDPQDLSIGSNSQRYKPPCSSPYATLGEYHSPSSIAKSSSTNGNNKENQNHVVPAIPMSGSVLDAYFQMMSEGNFMAPNVAAQIAAKFAAQKEWFSQYPNYANMTALTNNNETSTSGDTDGEESYSEEETKPPATAETVTH